MGDKRKMTKEEMKNKCAERAKIFQQAMKSCKSSNPIDCVEWFADRIAELEKENIELKEKLGDIQMQKAGEKSDLVSHLVDANTKYKEQLTEAKELIKNIIRVTWGEGWNYSLDWKVKAEQFIKNSEVEK